MSFRQLQIALLLGLAVLLAGAVTLPAQSADIRPDHSFPPVGDYDVLWCDFHMHTINSDGKVTSKDRVEEAYTHGYDAIAITDHGSTKSYATASPVADSLGIVLIRGLETGIAKNEHFVVLGVSEDYQPCNPHAWAEDPGEATVYYQDQLRRIADAGGYVIYAHPHRGFREPVQWAIQQGILQGIEVKNFVVGSGYSTVESHGTHCYPIAFDWALEHNLALFASSDLHGPRSEASCPATLVFVKERTADGVMEALRARRTVARFNGMLWGRADLLSDLLKSTVDVRRAPDPAGGDFVFVHNHGPVALQAALVRDGKPEQPQEIPPYSEVMVHWDGAPDTLTVRWENVWTSPRDNLQMTYSLTRP